MPFLIVHGMPTGTPSSKLSALRRILIRTIVREMNVPSQWVRVFFVPDMLGEPEVEEDGGNTVYARLDTAMFSGENADQDERAHAVVFAIAQMIWVALERKYEVEAFVGELNPKWKKLLLPED